MFVPLEQHYCLRDLAGRTTGISAYSRAVVLTDIFAVAAFAATVGFRWPLFINHTKKAVKFKYTFKLYQYFLI
jgi:hypothetical protein